MRGPRNPIYIALAALPFFVGCEPSEATNPDISLANKPKPLEQIVRTPIEIVSLAPEKVKTKVAPTEEAKGPSAYPKNEYMQTERCGLETLSYDSRSGDVYYITSGDGSIIFTDANGNTKAVECYGGAFYDKMTDEKIEDDFRIGNLYVTYHRD